MDGQVISNDEGNYSEEGEGYSDDEEMEYKHNVDQGQFQQEYEHDQGDYEYNNDEDIDGLADESVPSMPTGFYSEVDQFLNRPPPGLTINNPKGSKKKKKKGGGDGQKKQLPDIPDSQNSLSHVQSKVSTRRGGAGKKSSNKVMDERLLQQAFEYTNKLQQEAMVEEVYEASMSLQNQKSSSAPQLRPPQYEVDQNSEATRRGGGGSGGIAQRKPRSADGEYSQSHTSSSTAAQRQQAAYGQGKKKHPNSVVRRLRSKTQTSSGGGSKQPRNRSTSGGFDTSCDMESATSTRNVVDFNSLVANFEQGTNLQQLREELEQSKASMAESRRAMQDISKEMSGKMRI